MGKAFKEFLENVVAEAKEEEMTQNVKPKKDKTSEILKHLKVKGSITSIDAFKLYGATRLSAIIFNLRKRGYDITTESEECVDRYGHKCTFARYILNED